MVFTYYYFIIFITCCDTYLTICVFYFFISLARGSSSLLIFQRVNILFPCFFIFLKDLSLFIWVCICSYVCIYHKYVDAHKSYKRLTKGIRSPWSWSYSLSVMECGCWDLNSGPLKEQQGLLITEPLLQSFLDFSVYFFCFLLYWFLVQLFPSCIVFYLLFFF